MSDEFETPYRRSDFYRNSAGACECDMCTADPAVETELTVEDTE